MDIKDFSKILSESKLPISYYAFPAGTNPSVPFVVFYESETNHIYADNTIYYTISEVTVELYVDKRDSEIEKKLEQLFLDKGLLFEKSEVYIDTEKLIQISYIVEVLR